MKTLSWFLYFADTLGDLKSTLSTTFLIGLGGVSFISIWLSLDGDHSFWKWISVPIIVLVLSTMIPSKNTMYAIAASELGEQAMKSTIGQKSLKAVELWIDKQLEQPIKKY